MFLEMVGRNMKLITPLKKSQLVDGLGLYEVTNALTGHQPMSKKNLWAEGGGHFSQSDAL